MKTITVLAARTQLLLEDGQCDVVDTNCGTVTEARHRARYLLTDEAMRNAEASQPLGYSQVVVDGQCVADYFRKV